jgi:hypothetical protein
VCKLREEKEENDNIALMSSRRTSRIPKAIVKDKIISQLREKHLKSKFLSRQVCLDKLNVVV